MNQTLVKPRGSGTRIGFAAVALAMVTVACGGGSGGGDSLGTAGAAVPTAVPGHGDAVAAAQAFALFDGTPATLATFGGSPLVLNFWASWCPSCVAEMSAAFRPVQEQVGDRVVFLGMNIQDDRSDALELLAETDVQWISAEDADGSLYLELGGIAMPFTVFISPEGEVLDTHNGPLTESQLRDRIADVLGV